MSVARIDKYFDDQVGVISSGKLPKITSEIHALRTWLVKHQDESVPDGAKNKILSILEKYHRCATGYFTRLWPFLLINVSKLTLAAYAWSWGFLLVDGEECWAIDTTFSHAPGDTACTMEALAISGLMASVTLILTLLVLETGLGVMEEDRTSHWSYFLLFFSVWISDSSWSYWNWLSNSIANSADSDQPNSVAAYACASLLGFGINAVFFAIVHNGGRHTLIRWTSARDTDVWRCDVPFMLVCFGAYYGFGPWAVYMNMALGTKSKGGIAFANAIGTLLGALLAVVLCYIAPALLWLLPPPNQVKPAASPTENKSDPADSVESIERSVEMTTSIHRAELESETNQDRPKQKTEKWVVDNPLQCMDTTDTAKYTV